MIAEITHGEDGEHSIPFVCQYGEYSNFSGPMLKITRRTLYPLVLRLERIKSVFRKQAQQIESWLAIGMTIFEKNRFFYTLGGRIGRTELRILGVAISLSRFHRRSALQVYEIRFRGFAKFTRILIFTDQNNALGEFTVTFLNKSYLIIKDKPFF